MNKRLTYIATALRAIEKAMIHVRFTHNPLLESLRAARRHLEAAKRFTIGGNLELSTLSLGNANTHLKLVLTQIEDALS